MAVAILMVFGSAAIGWCMTELPGYPRWWAPMPLTVAVPYIMSAGGMMTVIPVAAFAGLMSIPVLMGRTKIPLCSVATAFSLMLIACAYFATSIPYGRKFQGDAYVVAMGVIQLSTVLVLAACWIANRRDPKFAGVLFWHALLAGWFASYAFPYYGELL